MVRTYGNAPYRLAVVHGGPGALGSLACVAEALEGSFGVLEPLQSKYSVEALTLELAAQLREYAGGPIPVLGHSWGALLALLCAARFPQLVERLILVGCPPLEDRYVSQIGERRLKNLDPGEQERFRDLLCKLEAPGENHKDALLRELGNLVSRADNFAPLPSPENTLHPDGEMYASIWPEAAAMRSRGEFLRLLPKLSCPLLVLQGEGDPHPLEGVTEPLAKNYVHFSARSFPRCGHSPFLEQYAREEFYQLVRAACENR